MKDEDQIVKACRIISPTLVIGAIFLGGIFFYNSNWFQSTFMYENFYEDVCYTPFNVTKKGETITIPLKFKYDTCYDLSIAVPDRNVFLSRDVGTGILSYRFLSNGQVLAEGETYQPAIGHRSAYLGISYISILVFDLPLYGIWKDVELELTVKEPMLFLKPYEGKTACRINPDYDSKFDKCMNENMRMK